MDPNRILLLAILQSLNNDLRKREIVRVRRINHHIRKLDRFLDNSMIVLGVRTRQQDAESQCLERRGVFGRACVCDVCG